MTVTDSFLEFSIKKINTDGYVTQFLTPVSPDSPGRRVQSSVHPAGKVLLSLQEHV